MKILFIYPDIRGHKYFHQGIAWISSVLKESGHKTSLIYATHDIKIDDVIEEAKKHRPDIIAFSSTTNQYPFVKKVADSLKDMEIPMVCGGIHATLVPSEVISDMNFVCVGEGEFPMLELVDGLEQGKNVENIKNIWSKSGKEIIKNEIRPLISDLNTLPFPDRELFNYRALLKENGYCAELLAGRGCPYACTYCCNHALRKLYIGKGSYVRMRSVDNVLGEIKEVVQRYKAKSLWFYDDTFTMFPKWVEEFSKKYRNEFDLPFACNGRVENLNAEIISNLKSAGCSMMGIGVETGNEWLRETILKRKISNSRIIDGFRMVKEAGIEANAFYMVGLPFEKPDMIEDTLKLNNIIDPNGIQCTVFYPYRGTEAYDICKENGFLTGEHRYSYFDPESVLCMPELTKEQIKYYFEKFNALSKIKTDMKVKSKYPAIYPLYKFSQLFFGPERNYRYFKRMHDYYTKWFI